MFDKWKLPPWSLLKTNKYISTFKWLLVFCVINSFAIFSAIYSTFCRFCHMRERLYNFKIVCLKRQASHEVDRGWLCNQDCFFSNQELLLAISKAEPRRKLTTPCNNKLDLVCGNLYAENKLYAERLHIYFYISKCILRIQVK